MLALSIIMLIVEFILNIVIGVNAATGNIANNWVVLVLAMCCMAASIFALVKGIKGIRDPLIRGRSIATTIIASSAVVYGFAIVIIAWAAAAGVMAFGTNGDYTFTF